MASINQKAEPFNWSKFDRTHNNAIDLVAQAVGHAKKTRRKLIAVWLSTSYYGLFKTGTEVLMKKRLEGHEQLEFDGVKVNCASRAQFDHIRLEYHPLSVASKN